MLVKTVIVTLLLAMPAAGSPSRFSAEAQLKPTGCSPKIVGTKVELRGCLATAPTTGTLHGRLSLRYAADADIARGSGTQHGTLILSSANGKDELSATFTGVVSVASGVSRGRWVATTRSGVFLHLVGRSGSYVSRTPDQGVHVTFDVHA